jgi:hypothetical protein
MNLVSLLLKITNEMFSMWKLDVWEDFLER